MDGKMIEITHVRHTHPDVAAGTCYGHTDLLPDAGFEADAAAVRSGLGGGFHTIFTSPLRRCTMLAEACGYPDARRDVRLMEMNFGEWEMQKFGEIRDPRIEAWYADWMNVEAPGGESCARMRERVSEFLEDLKFNYRQGHYPHPDGAPLRVLIFGHAGVAAQLRMLLGGATPEQAFSSLPPFGGKEVFTISFPICGKNAD